MKMENKMKITGLYTGLDRKSYFEDVDCVFDDIKELGAYTKRNPASGIMFRETIPGKVFEKHNAPQPQYIIYLEGQIEVIASGGETRLFQPGDVLFATDTEGEGHISKSLTHGKSVIITTC